MVKANMYLLFEIICRWRKWTYES